MKKITIALIGNPNSGKTTLFNALTGSHQRVGNWPGVTVDRKTGYFEIGECNTSNESILDFMCIILHSSSNVLQSEKFKIEQLFLLFSSIRTSKYERNLIHPKPRTNPLEVYHVEIVDLPGIYSLSTIGEESAIDEKIAIDYLISGQADLIVNVVDANNLERNLYLTTQLLELNIPTVLAVNMADIAKKHGIKINIEQLTKELDCPATSLISSKKQGVAELETAIINKWNDKTANINKNVPYPKPINDAINILSDKLRTTHGRFLAIRLLEGDSNVANKASSMIIDETALLKQKISEELNEDTDILIADARYGMIRKWISSIVKTSAVKPTVTSAIDRIVLNRVLGIPIFLAAMYFMFFFAVNIGGLFQDFFQIGSNAIFVHGFAQLLSNLHLPQWLIIILSSGAGKGINTTLTFIPVLSAMFIFLALLEGTGYMARAGFVIDRLMCAIGLPGKSFVPMLIGFGCNVPAIMATRTLDNQRDRILTIMMTPFMSCGARLAIYAVFTAAFFPKGGQNVVFILYLTGIIVAILTGLILRKTLLKGEQSSLVMELPPYHMPTLRNIALQSWFRLESFIIKAGKIIVPICIIISALNSFNINGTINTAASSDNSVLATIGKTITPILKPIGIKQDNWPATVGLLTGIMAKEVVVGTLNTLYSAVGDTETINKTTYNVKKELIAAAVSIKTNLINLIPNLGNPISNAHITTNRNSVYGKMYQRFAGQIGGFAYLLFVLLYFPCIPAVATIFKELNWRWATFSMFWNTGIAYFAATIFYQLATFTTDPRNASFWIGLMLISFLTVVLIMRWLSNKITTPLETKQ